MRLKIIYTLAFAGLIALAAVLLITSRKSTIRPRNMNFALTEPSLVDKIILSYKTYQLVLEKEGSRWRLNGEYPARTETVNLFLQAMTRIEVLSPASRSILDTLTSRIDERGNRLKLFRGNKVVLSVAVYYEKESIPGTYMMDERFRKPFRVGLTGFDGDNIAGLFTPEISRWKDNLLLDYRPEDIAEVRMEYPFTPEKSFIITANPGQAPRLGPVTGSSAPGLADPQEITDYLSWFSMIRYSVPENPVSDPAGLNEPFAILTLTDKSQQVFRMKAYRIRDNGGSDFDINRYLAWVAGDSLPVVVKYSDTDPIMRSYGDFLKK
jgi:hypothetical protein